MHSWVQVQVGSVDGEQDVLPTLLVQCDSIPVHCTEPPVHTPTANVLFVKRNNEAKKIINKAIIAFTSKSLFYYY